MVVVLSSCRDSAVSFDAFDVQQQSSNLLPHGFTFLHKHRAVKNNFLFHVFYREQHSPHFTAPTSQFGASRRPGCILGLVPTSCKQGQLHCTPRRLSDGYGFLTCAPGSLSATLLHLWRPCSLQSITPQPCPHLNSFPFSSLKGFSPLHWNNEA